MPQQPPASGGWAPPAFPASTPLPAAPVPAPRTTINRRVRWRIAAPLLSLLLAGMAVFGALIALLGGIALLVRTTGDSSTSEPSDQAAAQTLKALLEAPTQVVALAFGGHLHGIAATGLGVLGLDARVRSVTVLVVFGLICRALSRSGSGAEGLPWRDALVASFISGGSAATVLSLAALALGIDASSRDGGELFTAFSPMLVAGSFAITTAVVFWALLPPVGHPSLPAPLALARVALASVWRLLWTFGLVVLVAALLAGLVLASRYGARPVLGWALTAPLAVGNGVLAALGIAAGGRLTWQADLPYERIGTVDLVALPRPVALGVLVAMLATALLTARRWRRLRETAGPRTPWWLLPLALLATGLASLWLVHALGAFSAGGSVDARIDMAWWTPAGWAVLGVLVDQIARWSPRRSVRRRPRTP